MHGSANWHQCSYESINTIVTADLLSEAAGADRRRLAVYDAIDELTTLLETCMDDVEPDLRCVLDALHSIGKKVKGRDLHAHQGAWQVTDPWGNPGRPRPNEGEGMGGQAG